MKYIFLLFIIQRVSSIDFNSDAVFFSQDAFIKGNVYPRSSLTINEGTIFQSITINGNIAANSLILGNTEEKTIFFIYGLTLNLTPHFFLMIDPVTGILYKQLSTDSTPLLTTQNIYKTVSTNTISSNNNELLTISSTNHENKKINIIFNAEKLDLNAKTFLTDNFFSPNETITFTSDVICSDTVTCKAINNETAILSNVSIKSKNPVMWKVTSTVNIDNAQGKQINSAADTLKIDTVNLSKLNKFYFTGLPSSTPGSYFLTLDDSSLKIAKTPIVPISVTPQIISSSALQTNDLALSCKNFIFEYPGTSLYLETKKITIDELNFGENVKILIFGFGYPNYQWKATGLALTAKTVGQIQESGFKQCTIIIKDTEIKKIQNFNNPLIMTNTATLGTADISFTKLQPLTTFTDYVVIYNNTLPAGGNVGALPRIRISSFNDAQNIPPKQSRAINQNSRENLFFNVIERIKNIYEKLEDNKKRRKKYQSTLLEKKKEYRQLSQKIIHKIKAIKKLIEKIQTKVKKINTVEKKTALIKKISHIQVL